METLDTDFEMVEQNGKQDGDVIIEDLVKSNRQTKSKEFSNLNGEKKLSAEEIVIDEYAKYL